MKFNALVILFFISIWSVWSQDYYPKNDGVKSDDTHITAFTNVKIYVTPKQIIERGTLLIKDGKVVSAGNSVSIPKNAVIIDLNGHYIYPSFIDIYSGFGIEKPKRPNPSRRSAQYDATREGYYWNDHIRPEQNAIAFFKFNEDEASKLRKAGFGVVNTHLQDGIIRGSGALIALTNQGGDAQRILESRSAQYLSFRKSVKSRQSYPTSIMGSMALLRQLYLDSDWYTKGHSNIKDRSIEALNSNKDLVQIFIANNKLNSLRADKVGDENNIQYVIVGGGNEYEIINEIQATNATYILPLNFPDAYDVENVFMANALELKRMRAWNQKPANPKIFAQHNIPFAFTIKGLKSPDQLKSKLEKAITYGLDKTTALEALTTIPARILKQSNRLGSLKNGSFANFLITSGDIFDKNTILYENWVKGYKYQIKDRTVKNINGNYTFQLQNTTYNLNVSGKPNTPKSKLTLGDKIVGSTLSYKDHWLNITFKDLDSTKHKFYRINSKIDKNSDHLSGNIIFPNGNELPFKATKKINDSISEKKKKNKKTESVKVYPITYPNVAYGFLEKPKQETILFKNATVWTNEEEGILNNTDVLINNGKISAIGKNLNTTNAKVIDATGKHLTSGIVDEHSHIAASSINEAGHNSSAEVSIEDVIDTDDINIYRNLSGGVTTIQILHGSANPIGGRSAILKLKWGESASNLLYKNAPKFIKFALGENVKQSNWGDIERNRFPQTRMGVEQVYIDYFNRAKTYDTKKKSGLPYRKDIEMEVLAEILNKERFISCHSYIQSEINMLMKVAEQFNFNINTFTHILEGYKVADKMKAHNVGGSTFSDWWAYKYEVNDAIPYNAAIMHNAGVLTAINSDDAEMSRRLNQEAAKSIKYGGVSEEDAWKFVTLNPAKLLHLDDRIGSIKVGKDADVVLWSGHPLSVYSKAEKTLIEGITYFDLERDKQMRAAIKKEKNELINMMLIDKHSGLKTQPIKKKDKHHFHCNSL